MGLIRDLFGLGKAAKNIAEVFVPNKTKDAAYEHREHAAAPAQFSSEFAGGHGGPFNQFVNGINRLPRPVLALGTVGLFVFAMTNPIAFSGRMDGLNTIPRELWWLLGAIVSFYFGARELHYVRQQKQPVQPRALPLLPPPVTEKNAAVADWLKTQD